MAARPASRPMTFTGCWTCKARKVRCDERPISCKNCEKRGVTCEGYGVRLQWVADSLDQTHPSVVTGGRRSLPLNRTGPRYNSMALDKFLMDIEQHSESECSLGPFSVFPLNPPTRQTKVIHHAPEAHSTALTISSLGNARANLSRPFLIESLGHDDPHQRYERIVTPGAHLSLLNPDYRLVQPIQESISGDKQVDALIFHYNVHVADVLQPIDHCRNPYRNIYLSTALEGMWYQQSGIQRPEAKAYFALTQSLLASSAFHLWNCDKSQTKYQAVAMKYRFCAIQSLQDAVNEANLKSHYKALMTAVLSLITIGLMSGEGEGFRAHIDAATQLRSLCSETEKRDSSSRHLNEIGAFLALLARTLTFQHSQTPWPGLDDGGDCAEEMMLQSSTCYEYVYGITPGIAAAISQTCRLAEHLARFRNEQGMACLPGDFREACEQLRNYLESWEFETENTSSISPGYSDSYCILMHTAKAWHGAALVYYYTRIRGANAVDLVGKVDVVAEHLHAAEDMKSRLDKEHKRLSMAPITWPGFIASCTAVPSRRPIWKHYWESIRRYNVAGNETQWQVIQKVWERMDACERQGKVFMEWTEAFVSLGIHILPS